MSVLDRLRALLEHDREYDSLGGYEVGELVEVEIDDELSVVATIERILVASNADTATFDLEVVDPLHPLALSSEDVRLEISAVDEDVFLVLDSDHGETGRTPVDTLYTTPGEA